MCVINYEIKMHQNKNNCNFRLFLLIVNLDGLFPVGNKAKEKKVYVDSRRRHLEGLNENVAAVVNPTTASCFLLDIFISVVSVQY